MKLFRKYKSWHGIHVSIMKTQLSFCQNDPQMGESFWPKESLLQYTMTLLQGPKDPVLPTLLKIAQLD